MEMSTSKVVLEICEYLEDLDLSETYGGPPPEGMGARNEKRKVAQLLAGALEMAPAWNARQVAVNFLGKGAKRDRFGDGWQKWAKGDEHVFVIKWPNRDSKKSSWRVATKSEASDIRRWEKLTQ